ncbi:AraC family transcriptional regulator [Ralstonia syzygii]|uniref:Putative transcriptional regulator, AraC family n=1 Tax=Ralstonia syzygii R24 TaxID=907261 RepID=G3AA42_9RALS|nr:AraC family transcriptional regulator [Ralstonia syzygii]CCA88176.1 putative transcriptional regulator, AraC family [Ralstonia syzygii R24]
MKEGHVVSQTAMKFACTITPNGSQVSWQPPANWKRRFISPLRSPVTIDHYVAGDSEILDQEATETMFAMCLRMPTTLELRTDANGWAPKRLRTPLMYVPAGFYSSSRWSEEMEWIGIHFDASWLARSSLQMNEQRLVSAMPRFDLSDDLLVQIVRSIQEDALAGMPLGPMYSEALGAAALRRVAYLESRPRAKEYAHAPMMRKAVEYIQDNFRDGLTLLMVANAVDYPGDLYSFIRSFKKANGLTPHQYIIENRLQAARILITSGQCDITEAALTCGFSTVSHFSATFRKRWGMSPSEVKPSSALTTRAEAIESIGR